MKKLFFLVAFAGSFVSAMAFRIEYGNNVVIREPVYEDLYVAGGTITIDAPVHGDLIIAGGTITINDTVTNDILLAGGNVNFNGYVGDDIRCAGGNIRISRDVAGDVVITGGGVIIDKGVTIGGLIASGGDVTVDGNVSGGIKGAFGNIFLNGTMAKDVDCRGGRITINGIIDGKATLAARNIVIENNAKFNNDVRYWNKKGSLDFKQSLKNGKASYDPALRIRNGEWYFLGSTSILGLLWYLGMAFLMILIIQYLFALTMKRAAETVFSNVLRSLGYGFLFFIAVPAAAIISFVTIIGVPVGLLLLFSYIALILLATVITSLVAAHWLNNRNNYQWNFWRLVFTAFGIFIILKLASLTPIVGGLIMILLACTAFGGIVLNVNWKRRQQEVAGAFNK